MGPVYMKVTTTLQPNVVFCHFLQFLTVFTTFSKGPKTTVKHECSETVSWDVGTPRFFGILHGKKHSAPLVLRWCQKVAGGLVGLVGWLVGWLAGWLDGWLAGWLAGWLVGWLAGWLVGWLAGWLAGWLVGWLDGWLAGWLVGWLDGWLAGWLVYRLAGWLVYRLVELVSITK